MTTYVINPITNELESAQPKQRVADKFKLEDMLTPGPLRDELKEDFDPTQETYEEYLRRINLRKGGRVNFDRGGLAQVFNYLESLPKGTELSISDIMKYVEDNNIDVVRSTLEARLQSVSYTHLTLPTTPYV